MDNIPFRGDAPVDNLGRIYQDGKLADLAAEQLATLCAQCGTPVIVLFMDVDRMGEIRKLGIDYKLHALAQIHSRVKSATPPEAILFGMGSHDELVVALPVARGEDSLARASAAAEHIRQAAARRPVTLMDGSERACTVRVGTAVWPIDSSDPAMVLGLAQSAAHMAKQLGGNVVLPANVLAAPEALTIEASRPRISALMRLANQKMSSTDALLREAVALVCERHAGLEQFHPGLADMLEKLALPYDTAGKTVVVAGPPASGKTSLVAYLKDSLPVSHFAVRQQLAVLRNGRDPLAERIDRHLLTSPFIADELVCQMLVDFLGTLPKDRNVIIEGLPISRSQATSVLAAMLSSGRGIDLVAMVAADAETLAARASQRLVCSACESAGVSRSYGAHQSACLVCGGSLTPRQDDRSEHFERRIALFRDEQAAISSAFDGSKIIILDSTRRTVSELAQEVLTALFGPLP